MSPIQLQCEQGLVNTPDVFVCCPCHGVNQCGPHILLSRAKPLMGAVFSALAVFWFGSQFQAVGYLLVWAQATDPGALSRGKFLIRHLLWWLSFISTVKSALYLQCKGQHASSNGSPCLRLPQWTVSLSWSFDTLDHPQRRGKNSWPQVHWRSPQSTISLDSWTLQQQEHRQPRQGTCLKSQRPLLEDSWTSSCMRGTPVQPLSQGLCGMGKVVLGNPNWPAVT